MKKLNCILLIDDNADDNFFHSLTIKRAGAAEHIKIVKNGVEALEYFEKTQIDPVNYPMPDLAFLDINMPGLNGFEFLEKAIEKKILRDGEPVVIVMLTNSLNPDDEKMAKDKYAREIKGYINKPLTVETLNEIIEKYFS